MTLLWLWWMRVPNLPPSKKTIYTLPPKKSCGTWKRYLSSSILALRGVQSLSKLWTLNIKNFQLLSPCLFTPWNHGHVDPTNNCQGSKISSDRSAIKPFRPGNRSLFIQWMIHHASVEYRGFRDEWVQVEDLTNRPMIFWEILEVLAPKILRMHHYSQFQILRRSLLTVDKISGGKGAQMETTALVPRSWELISTKRSTKTLRWKRHALS